MKIKKALLLASVMFGGLVSLSSNNVFAADGNAQCGGMPWSQRAQVTVNMELLSERELSIDDLLSYRNIYSGRDGEDMRIDFYEIMENKNGFYNRAQVHMAYEISHTLGRLLPTSLREARAYLERCKQRPQHLAQEQDIERRVLALEKIIENRNNAYTADQVRRAHEVRNTLLRVHTGNVFLADGNLIELTGVFPFHN